MAYRRRGFRRRTRRVYRRIKKYRRRVPRSLKGNSKRFFKVRGIRDLNVDQDKGVVAFSVLDVPPNDSGDFKSMGDLFEFYRVNAISCKFIPYFTQTPLSNTVVTPIVRPILISHDKNGTISVSNSSIDLMLQYENLKVKSANRMWTVYYKMNRNIVVGQNKVSVFDTRGYQRIGDPQSTQGIIFYCEIPNAKDVKISSLGKLITTWYCTFKDRV